ncbi:MAG: CU044_5270 family protein [Actinomycetota bacterium]
MNIDPPDPRPLPPASRKRIREMLVAEARRATPPTRKKTRLFVSAAAIIATAVAAPIALSILLGAGSPGGPSYASAEEALQAASKAAAEVPPIVIPPGTYLHRQITVSGRVEADSPAGTYVVSVPSTQDVWVGANGAGRITSRYGEWAFPTAVDRERWVAAGRPTLGASGVDSCDYEAGRLKVSAIDDLPRDADELYRKIEAETVRGSQADYPKAKRAQMVFGEIADLLTNVGSPESRAALFAAAAQVPGIELRGEVIDGAGRRGVGVGVTWAGIREEIIFDPVHAYLLARRTVQVDPPVEYTTSPSPGMPVQGINADGIDDPGTVLGASTYLEAEVVETLPRSPGRCQ